MSYTAAPGETRRPAVVTVAVWLLYVSSALQALIMVLTVSQLTTLRDVYNELYANTNVRDPGDRIAALSGAYTVGLGVLLAVGYIVLAIYVGRGRHAARVITWAVAGVSICYSGMNLVSLALSLDNKADGSGGPTPEQIQKAINAALPSWYDPLLTTLTASALGTIVIVVVLLTLPIANPYFRRDKPVRQPAADPAA